ncbi:MAG TPA: AAA family ATPase, partial [Candidatus Baltobacteraceae bacterium]|nr:AAA family ATPase [Candidatus Baltobacteraceae bacterium]
MAAVRSIKNMRAYAHTLVTTGIVLLFAIAEWWTERYVSDRSRAASTAIEIAIVLLATLAFRPIHQRVEQAVEAAFTKRKREAREALLRFKKELSSYNDTRQLLRRIVEMVDHHGDAAGSAIYLRRDVFRAEASSFDSPAAHVQSDDPLIVRLQSAATPANPRTLNSAAVGTVAFPMTSAGELVGFLSVEKRRGEYESDEYEALEALVESAAFALVALEPHLQTQSRKAKGNLPAGLTPVVGRETEMNAIAASLEQSRLVTITGAGGIGKTRIALQVAENASYRDGAWLVDLAPIDDPELVHAAIAHTFDVPDDGSGHLVDRLAATLKSRQLLIVLDNCEHVVHVAANVAKRLLDAAPDVRIVATSREPLAIPGETPYRLPALEVPPAVEGITAAEALKYSSVHLFASRVKMCLGEFDVTDENAEAVARIVRHVDGMALAIELAAPRVKVLTLKQLDQRLDEHLTRLSGGARTAQPRHKTMRALISWSYELLSAPEKRLLQRSAIFRGTWTIEAIEALCEGDLDGEEVHDVLLALIDKSLINVESAPEERRYRLLESTRQFALERLDEAGDRERVSARHCEYFAGVAQSAANEYWRTDYDAWAALVRRDLENYRAAIGWGLSAGGDTTCALTIAAHLRWFWYTSSRREGRALLERALSLETSRVPDRVHGLLALTVAVDGSSGEAVAPAARAASALSDGVDDLGYIEATTLHGIALGRSGHVDEALKLFEEAISAVRTTGLPRLIGWVLSMVGYWMAAAHDRDRAGELFDDAAEQLRSCNDAWQLARLQLHRAEFLFAADDPDGALESVREAEALYRARNASSGLCVAVLNAAAYLIALARLEEALNYAREGLELAQRHGIAMPGVWAIGH